MRISCAIVAILFFVIQSTALNCDDVLDLNTPNNNLPCIEIKACDVNEAISSSNKLYINKLSIGGKSNSTSTVQLCYSDDYLSVNIESFFQYFYPTTAYEDCNDSIFLTDVVEVFISQPIYNISDNGIYYYSEIDISPSNSIYEAEIYNPNLNHSGVVGTEIDCAESGILHETIKSTSSWVMKTTIPFNVIDGDKSLSSSRKGSIYRANFYRVNELVSTTKCSTSSGSCEYMAWSPTNVNPPAFHEPTKFGYIFLN
eukprot:gene14853-19961_t